MNDDFIKDLEAAVRTKEALHETFINNIEARLKQHRDRIEKLEAALAHIYAWYPISVAGPLQTVHEIRDFARKALEGKDG